MTAVPDGAAHVAACIEACVGLIEARTARIWVLSRQEYWHALPDGWEEMDYAAFLAARRRLWATWLETHTPS